MLKSGAAARLSLALLPALLAGAMTSGCERQPAPAIEGADGREAAKRVALPDCGEVEGSVETATGLWILPDCRRMLDDGSGLAFEARYATTAAGDREVTIQVVATGDATLQTFTETMDGAHAPPHAEDVNNDGKQDILVSRYQGMVNTTWAVWLQTPGPQFVRAGEIFGNDIQFTESGYVAAAGRSSAASWTVTFHAIREGQLVTLASVDVTAENEGGATDADGNPLITGTTCALSADSPVPQGMAAEQAQQVFCAEPIVTRIFN